MSTAENATRGTLRAVDDRLGGAKWLRKTFNKAFPDHWSFMLGEIALYSFIILLLTGVFLTLFFHASSSEVIYNGAYHPLRGVPMTDAYASTLKISFEVRGGLLIRQIHHWAALLFVASIFIHAFRVFFTGAFRKPREVNWIIGTTLLVLGILEGFAGYSLPDDLLSGTGIRIAYSVMESIPVVGTYMAYFVFGGDFPGVDFIPRLFVIHVLLVPGIILAMISAHMMIIWHQKHTDFPGVGKSETVVTGSPLWPVYAAKGGGFFFIVFGVLALMAGFAQINPVWLYGPYNPAQVSAGSQPDFYIGFLEGSLRMMPNLETNLWGHTISWNILVPGVILPGILFTAFALYPFIEAWATKDKAFHDVLDRPRDRPVRTALGAMAIAFYGVLLFAGGNDILATTFDWSIQSTTWMFRVLLISLPPIAFYFTRRICLGLQHADDELLHHGVETGIIRRLPSGEYIEVTRPLADERAAVLARQLGQEHTPALPSGNGHGAPGNGHGPARPASPLTRMQRAVEGFFFERREAQPEDEPEEPRTLTKP
jgi:ubiquinol-cytochrome c reductase cytochrome b subunit